ncbi:MAG: homoserine dehydrogenase, partial [Xanthomonadaceae bacterium]|nr:homoserine dehydrogenase [Xanthomonadaceae bacterium]
MSAVLDAGTAGAASAAIPTPHRSIATEAAPAVPAAPTVAIVLLGTGVVGGALLKLLNTPAAARVRLVGAANSRRQQTSAARLASRSLREQLNNQGDVRDNAALLAALDHSGAAARVIIDATASTALASQHAQWLARGYHVVTANKALAGGDLAGWRALQAATANGGRYGDAATVGA